MWVSVIVLVFIMILPFCSTMWSLKCVSVSPASYSVHLLGCSFGKSSEPAKWHLIQFNTAVVLPHLLCHVSRSTYNSCQCNHVQGKELLVKEALHCVIAFISLLSTIFASAFSFILGYFTGRTLM
ncbi:hypothetical protein NC651_002591 [Populus alba x Populus x berolinensis]|nr:hypothetical protein NC651_002591 [Populus alba x Populus x berolinensis]